MVIVARRRRAPVVLLVVVLALIALGAPWSPAPRAESQRPAINRQGELGDAPYLICAENWQGGLVVFAHGIQRGPGRGDVDVASDRQPHRIAPATRGSRPATARANTSLTCSSRIWSRSASSS